MTELRIKRCQVCADEASGFNFTVLTCGSCRLFFHRNYTKQLTCRRENACPIEANSRKSCSKCRLVKCFAIGMKKKPPKASPQASPASNPEIGFQVTSPSPSSTSSSTDLSLRSLPAPPPPQSPLVNIEALLEASIRNETTLAQISANYLLEKSFFVTWRKANCTTLALNRHERRHLDLVNGAFSVFANENEATTIVESNDVISNFNLPAIYATRIVRFCKQFPDFKALPQDNQLAILKPFYAEMMAIRIAFNYDIVRGGYPLLQDETGTHVVFIKNQLDRMPSQHLVMQNRAILGACKLEFEGDTTLRNIVTAMCLFKPREGLPCNEPMRYKYFQYCNLLRRYLEAKYGNLEAASGKFTRLIEITAQLHTVRRNYGILLQELGCGHIVQVLAELYDLDT